MDTGILSPNPNSAWGAPTFAIPKKDRKIRIVSDFRELNKRLVCTSFWLPNIRDLCDLILYHIKYFTTLDILQGYYQLKLSSQSRDICTIVVPWGKFCYNSLSMGIGFSPDLFQRALGDLFLDMQNVLIYLDNILIVSHRSFKKTSTLLT